MPWSRSPGLTGCILASDGAGCHLSLRGSPLMYVLGETAVLGTPVQARLGGSEGALVLMPNSSVPRISRCLALAMVRVTVPKGVPPVRCLREPMLTCCSRGECSIGGGGSKLCVDGRGTKFHELPSSGRAWKAAMEVEMGVEAMAGKSDAPPSLADAA